MEPAEAKMTILLGEYQVVEVKGNVVSIHLRQGITIHAHIKGITHTVKEGQILPLYTEITYALPSKPSVQ